MSRTAGPRKKPICSRRKTSTERIVARLRSFPRINPKLVSQKNQSPIKTTASTKTLKMSESESLFMRTATRIEASSRTRAEKRRRRIKPATKRVSLKKMRLSKNKVMEFFFRI
jgi:hypothetical protein